MRVRFPLAAGLTALLIGTGLTASAGAAPAASVRAEPVLRTAAEEVCPVGQWQIAPSSQKYGLGATWSNARWFIEDGTWGGVCGFPSSESHGGYFGRYTSEDGKSTGWAQGGSGTALRFFQFGNRWFEKGDLRSVVDIPADRTECPADKLCLYRDPYYKGGGLEISGRPQVDKFEWFGFSDTMSSYVNNTDNVMCFFVDNDQGGISYSMSAHGKHPNMSGSYSDDNASSLRASTGFEPDGYPIC
ncbi:peptidase inhibitor family I36 protein [Streptomyces sp. NPDC051567]|uniref:peptidase inhibitor family I36 protein n=1 Tax=Streptomyces sp. NPDC051567 TaxID=3365660 RepID=UPI0037B40C84